jgi:ABC-2 type transport system permease protein
MTKLLAQTRVEVTLTARRGESLLLTLGIPVLLLVFFSAVDVLPTGGGKAVDFLAPGVLALAVMSTAMVGLGIATGFERSYGVLKRLAATPLTRGHLVAAKIVTILVVEVVQFAVLMALARLMGWRPGGGWALVLVPVVLGSAAFAGIGLTMAGRLPGTVNLAAANGLYLVLLLLGGMVVTLDKLPAPLRVLAKALPSGALSQALRGAFGTTHRVPGASWLVLVAWAVLAPTVAALTFRWE